MFDEPEPEPIELTKELEALERQLSAMTPAALRVDRDKLMFEAGRAAALARPTQPVYIAGPSWAGRYIVGPFRAGSRLWPAATAMMTAASLMLATTLVWQRQSMLAVAPEVTPQIVTIPANDLEHAANARPAVQMAVNNGDRPMLRHSTTGYLGVRYVALTHGISALTPDENSSASDRDNSTDELRQPTPATARKLFEELVPTAKQKTDPRS